MVFRRQPATPLSPLVVPVGSRFGTQELLLIEKDSPKVGDLSTMFQQQEGWYNDDFYQTQYKILQSRPVIEAVIKEHNPEVDIIECVHQPQYLQRFDVEPGTPPVRVPLWNVFSRLRLPLSPPRPLLRQRRGGRGVDLGRGPDLGQHRPRHAYRVEQQVVEALVPVLGELRAALGGEDALAEVCRGLRARRARGPGARSSGQRPGRAFPVRSRRCAENDGGRT